MQAIYAWIRATTSSRRASFTTLVTMGVRPGGNSSSVETVRQYLEGLDGYVQIAFLPAYAPDLNPGRRASLHM